MWKENIKTDTNKRIELLTLNFPFDLRALSRYFNHMTQCGLEVSRGAGEDSILQRVWWGASVSLFSFGLYMPR